MQSNTVRGGILGLIGIVLISLIQLLEDKLLAIGLSPEILSTAKQLLQILTGTGATIATIGMRQAQGQAIVAAERGAAVQTLAAAKTTRAAEKIETAAEKIE